VTRSLLFPALAGIRAIRPVVAAIAPLAAMVLVALSLLTTGCSVHPAGTNNVSIVYETNGAPPPSLVALARTRLTAAQIVASVDATDRGIVVQVDRDESGAVDALLTWRGGVAFYDPAPGEPFTVSEPNELERKTEASAGAIVETYYTGPIGAVARAVRQTTLRPGIKLLVWDLGDERARTLLVRDPPRIDATEGIDRATAAGRDLVLTFSETATRDVDAATSTLGATKLALARDRNVLAFAPLAASTKAISLGDDLAAYATARSVAALLSTPPLPRLTRASAVGVPTDVPLMLAGTGVPLLLSLAWLFFVRRFDRAQPEPFWLVFVTFVLGCLSVIPAAIAEIGWMRASEWLDPSLVTMGGAVASLPIALPVFALVIGLSEEGSKFLATWSLAYHRKEFDEPVDGIIYGAASSLGFAAVENVKYFAVGRMMPALIVVRMFMSVPAHLFFGAIWGYALGRALVRPKTRLLSYLVLAAIAHGTFDAFLSYPRLSGLAFALNLGMATLFVLLLRRSLRYGVVTAATRAADPRRRRLFVVGSAPGFLFWAATLHVIAGLLFVASAFVAAEHSRIGVLFALGMSSLVVLLGVSAYFLSRALPLDVVLDDYGLTFAGASRRWSSIRALEPSPRGLHVRSSEGDIWIGPAERAATVPIARAIGKRLASSKSPAASAA
jgi:RsiW-degrading membrane proteinase PrsW (M82 family)